MYIAPYSFVCVCVWYVFFSDFTQILPPPPVLSSFGMAVLLAPRRASAGDALPAGAAKRGGGGGRAKAAKGKGKKAKATKRRRKSTGSAPLSDSSGGEGDAAGDDDGDDEDWA